MTETQVITLLKCLADKSRLQIVKSLAKEDMYTELLAERLGLTPATISFHMKKLEEAGLVSSKKEQYYTIYSLNKEFLELDIFDIIQSAPDETELQEKREAEYRKKVIDAFFEYGKLKSIPTQRKKKRICLEEIAKDMKMGFLYDEQGINSIILKYHEDYCTIRRDMISEGILARDGNIYIRKL